MKINITRRSALLLVVQLISLVEYSQGHKGAVQIGVLYSKHISNCFEDGRIYDTLSVYPGGIRVHWKAVMHSSSIVISRDVCELVDLNIVAVVTMLPLAQQETVNIQTKSLGILHLPVDTSPVDLPSLSPLSVRVSPPLSSQGQLIRDLVDHVCWTEVAVIFDAIIENKHRDSLISHIADGQRRITTLTASVTSRGVGTVSPAISISPVTKHSNFIFIGRAEIWTRFIQTRSDLLEHSIYWLVVSDISPCQLREIVKHRPLSNVVLALETWRRCCTRPIEANITSPTLLEMILENSLMALSDSVQASNIRPNFTCSRYVRPTTFLPTEPLEGLVHYGMSRSDVINPDFFTGGSCLKSAVSTLYTIPLPGIPARYDLYGSYGNKHVALKLVGEWRSDSGVVTENPGLFLNTFHQFHRNPVLVAATYVPPFVNSEIYNGGLSYKGFSVDILDEIAVRMGFNYTIIEPPDNFFGAPNPDGSWNGMVGMVQRGEADMAIGPFTITSLRDEVIDFTVPFAEGSTGILYLSPGVEANKSLFQTLKPFSVLVWFSLVVAVFFVGFISFLVNHCTPYGRTEKEQPFQAKYESSLGDNMWLVYGSVTEQGILDSPEAVSGRCVLGLWWIFTILLVSTYTANLAAVLVVSLPPPSINNLGELIGQDKIQPIVQEGTSYETIFKEAGSDLYRKAWDRIQQSPKITELPDIFELVKEGNYALIDDRPLLEYAASNSCLTYAVADERFDGVGYGMVIPEGAPYKSIINNVIRKMREAGLMDKWRIKHWAPSSLCRDISENSVRSLDLGSLGGLFFGYLGIVILAFMFLALKFVVHLTYSSYQLRHKQPQM